MHPDCLSPTEYVHALNIPLSHPHSIFLHRAYSHERCTY